MKLMDRNERRQGPTSQREITTPGDAETGLARVADQQIAGSRIVRGLWFGAGWLAVAVGGVGVVVPGLPTTGFMIIAAACFARCSPRFEQWVLNLPGVGRSVANYRAGLGMPMRAKVTAISMMAIAISISVGVLLDNNPVRIAIIAAGLSGVWYILRSVPTAPAANPSTPSDSS
jgi:uncharacterized membrane protein YbaN (DUF454 family)